MFVDLCKADESGQWRVSNVGILRRVFIDTDHRFRHMQAGMCSSCEIIILGNSDPPRLRNSLRPHLACRSAQLYGFAPAVRLECPHFPYTSTN